jgi:hypothetical protein
VALRLGRLPSTALLLWVAPVSALLLVLRLSKPSHQAASFHRTVTNRRTAATTDLLALPAAAGAVLPTSSLADRPALAAAVDLTATLTAVVLLAVALHARLAVQETDAGLMASTCPAQTTLASSVNSSENPRMPIPYRLWVSTLATTTTFPLRPLERVSPSR